MSDRPDLDARMDELRARQEKLMAELPAMDPLVGARAFSTLADEMDALQAEYEAHLRSKHEGES